MAVCTICIGGCSYILFISLSFTVTVSHIHLQSETQTCTGACMHIHTNKCNAINWGQAQESQPPSIRAACVCSHQCAMILCVLVPQVFTGPYSIDDICLWWLFCTGNHHSNRHLKDDDALWCNSGKNKGLCARAVLGGAYVFLLETSIYAC